MNTCTHLVACIYVIAHTGFIVSFSFLMSGGLKSYIWLMLILVPILATVLCMPFLILWRVKRRQRYISNIDNSITVLMMSTVIQSAGRDGFMAITGTQNW